MIKGLLAKTGVKPDDIEDLILGCAFPEGEQGLNVARLIALIAGLPQSVAGATVNRFCGSSMQSIHMAAGADRDRAPGEAFICAGVESMSRVPMMGFNPMPNPALAEQIKGAYMSMGETAENVATQIPDHAQGAGRRSRSQPAPAAAARAGRQVHGRDRPDRRRQGRMVDQRRLHPRRKPRRRRSPA